MQSSLPSPNGKTRRALVCLIVISIMTSVVAAENKAVKKEIVVRGGYGHRDGEVGYLREEDSSVLPSAIVIDLDGNIYIADNVNERIVEFNKDGKFVSKIDFHVTNKRYDVIINDLATDFSSGNLYVASRHEMKIAKFSRDGKPLLSINLRDKKICWSKKKNWHDCAFQIEGINLDPKGNIYLKGFHELIKLDLNGNILKQFVSEIFPSFFLDESENLYINVRWGEWEKYDSEGNSLGSIKCTEPYFTLINGRCRYPIFVDKNGFIYLFDSVEKSVAKKDVHGKYYGQYKMQHDYPDNFVKFDAYGNLYIMELDKKQFTIVKVSWGQ